MDTKEKYTLADQVVDYALKKGAQQISVVISDSRSSNIEIRDNQIDRLTESNRNRLTINLYVDRKYSSHSTNRLKKEDVFKFVDEAIAATRFLAEDEYRTLPEPELYYKGGGAAPDNLDEDLDNIAPEAKIDLAYKVFNEASGKDDRIISVSSFYSDNIGGYVMVTSNGFRGDNSRSSISLYTTVAALTDSGRPSDYWYESAMFWDKLKKSGIGEKALERTLKKIGPRKISSGKYTMLLENRVVPNLFDPFSSALSGYNLQQKQSFLIGKAGKEIGSPLLTVTDDPLLEGGPESRLFDDEGLAAVRMPVIEDGVLKNYYIDTYYGKKLGMKPTTGNSSNMVFRLGSRDLDEMKSSVKKGILVTGFNGGNCNRSTGDFSYGIEGFLIENGKEVHPVNEMNISGNMNEILFSLVELGNDTIEGSSFLAPSMMFDKIDFSGI